MFFYPSKQKTIAHKPDGERPSEKTKPAKTQREKSQSNEHRREK